ncbi:PQQ-dependent sugar dehydrogenase [Paraburkholderia sp. BL27I4N3]|uniref:PQQ-dependent sugar dehydrogenase n=1 Tax=Paraburkholderia sp. BL27I4N3 TaxID=1938805 RepID=UPI0015F29082|nr:PQQ-dependent sugar dehydrogenase [Paraburkholderia sp. BL27I4N3]
MGTSTGNPPIYQPAFGGQTKVPRPLVRTPFKIEQIARGLEFPWSVKFLPDGDMLVTEKVGRLRVVTHDGKVLPPIIGLPPVDQDAAKVKGGLLDVLLARDFSTTRRIYWSYSEKRPGGSSTAVATGVLSSDYSALDNVKVIWQLDPVMKSYEHYGSRLVWDKAGRLFITTGERAPDSGEFGRDAVLKNRMEAQNPENDLGKIVRINPDGSIPSDNPFAHSKKTKATIWSLGHRNVLGAAVDPESGRLWTVEHGPKGGDELNQPEAGKNYGWPIISYGIEYHDGAIGAGLTRSPGLEQPIYYWDPNIAPSALIFYTGTLFPNWKGDLIASGLASARLSRLIMDGRRVVGEEWLILGKRVRDVVQAPDGSLYVATDEKDGEILRISPK